MQDCDQNKQKVKTKGEKKDYKESDLRFQWSNWIKKRSIRDLKNEILIYQCDCNKWIEKKLQKILIIPQADAAHQNIAVMIHFQYTTVTLSAMMSSLRFESLAGFAKPHVLFLHEFLNIFVQKHVLK